MATYKGLEEANIEQANSVLLPAVNISRITLNGNSGIGPDDVWAQIKRNPHISGIHGRRTPTKPSKDEEMMSISINYELVQKVNLEKLGWLRSVRIGGKNGADNKTLFDFLKIRILLFEDEVIPSLLPGLKLQEFNDILLLTEPRLHPQRQRTHR